MSNRTSKPLKIEISKKKQGGISIQPSDKKAPIVIQHPVKIDRPNTPNNQIFNSPKVSSRPLTPNNFYGSNQPPPHFQQPPLPSQISKPAPQVQVQKPNAPPHIAAASSHQPNPAQTIPQHDAFCRLSLLSFVSSFEDQKTFNETDLSTLGLDLKCQEPLLPMLHSVLSDAPLLDHSRHPMPECYSKLTQVGKPHEKLSLFSDQTLLFIFYTYPRDSLQVQAANELIKREYAYDEETEEWRNHEGFSWSVDQWKEMEEVDQNEPVMADE